MIFKDRLQATFLCHLQVRNEIKKKRKNSRFLWVDHCLCEVQQMEVDDKFIPIFYEDSATLC